MKVNIAATFALLATPLLFMVGQARAQQHIESIGKWNNPIGASMSSLVNDRLWVRVRAKARARVKARNSAPAKTLTRKTVPLADPEPSAKTSPQTDAAVRFRPTGTQLKAQAFAEVISADADTETKRATFVLISTLLTEYEKAARLQGQPNDLALALTAALVYNSCIYNGTPEPDDTRIMAIRDTIAETAAENGTFASLNDRQKQELYESMVITTLLAKAGYEEAQKTGDKTTMATYRELAGQTLKLVSGLPPGQINFSAQMLDVDNVDETVGTAPAFAADYLEFDPFPDKPYVQSQQPLLGRLCRTITPEDLAGTWEIGGASVTTYFSSGNYVSTDTSFFGEKYSIRSDGTFTSKFQGRTSNTTIRESDSGTIVLSGNFIIVKGRSKPAMRYQFVSYMSQPNGAAVLTLIYIGDNPPLSAESLAASCGHAHGYITCVSGEEWVRSPR
jgi:hypothetical protein